MAERGYRLEQNLSVERRGAQGRNSELPRLAQELVAAKVEVIITIGFPPVVAAKSTSAEGARAESDEGTFQCP